MALSVCRYWSCPACGGVYEKPDFDLKWGLMQTSDKGRVAFLGTGQCGRCQAVHQMGDIYAGKLDLPEEHWPQAVQTFNKPVFVEDVIGGEAVSIPSKYYQPIPFQCPNGHDLKAPVSRMLESVKCPRCQTTAKIPRRNPKLLPQYDTGKCIYCGEYGRKGQWFWFWLVKRRGDTRTVLGGEWAYFCRDCDSQQVKRHGILLTCLQGVLLLFFLLGLFAALTGNIEAKEGESPGAGLLVLLALSSLLLLAMAFSLYLVVSPERQGKSKIWLDQIGRIAMNARRRRVKKQCGWLERLLVKAVDTKELQKLMSGRSWIDEQIASMSKMK